MSFEAPSDSLRDVYERRAEIEYAEPVALPDPLADLKFGRMTELVAGTFPADSLLDAGCGDGRFLAAIARLPNRPARLVGCDIAERILLTARQAVEREGAAAEFVRANLERLPFADATFDRVLCVQVVEHLLDVDAGVAELARVLSPGGTLVLSTDSSENWVSRALNAPRKVVVSALGLTGRRRPVSFPHRAFRRAEITASIERAGLNVEQVETFRFHIDGVKARAVRRALNALDRKLSPHRYGDIIAVVARRP